MYVYVLGGKSVIIEKFVRLCMRVMDACIACIYAWMCACVGVLIHVRVCPYVYIGMYRCMYVYKPIYVYVCMIISLYICINMYV